MEREKRVSQERQARLALEEALARHEAMTAERDEARKKAADAATPKQKTYFTPAKLEYAYLMRAQLQQAATALEAAAHALFPAALDDLEEGVERAVLEAICAAGSVDGKYVERPLSVDGMAWEPVPRDFYEMLWGLAEDKG